MHIKNQKVKKLKVLAHKYLIEIEHEELEKPFKIVLRESIAQDTGESLGWSAAPEIQLRQTIHLKQEYIVSNVNPTKEGAVQELLMKMFATSSREIFYKKNFEELNNKLW